MAHGLAHLIMLITPAAAVLAGTGFIGAGARTSALAKPYQDFILRGASERHGAGLLIHETSHEAAKVPTSPHETKETVMEGSILVPIAFFAMIAAIVLVPRYLRDKERVRMHETLRYGV